MRALIIGGGIGGLVTALHLREAGIECSVFEQSGAVRGLGVGVNVLPNAVTELARLELLSALDQVAIRTAELIYANRQGQVIWREPKGLDAGYDTPQFSIHRGHLQEVLYEAVSARLGDTAVRTGHRLIGFDQDEGGVSAQFVDRSGAPLDPVHGDFLVGADGIHSTVRAALFPDEGPPRWNGVTLWRGATEWPAFRTGRSVLIAGGMRAKLVVYPIAAGSTHASKLTNWVVCVQTGEGSTPPRREDWSRPGRRDELVQHLGLFAMPGLDVPGLVAATSEFYEFPMCDRDPLPRWSHSRVTLLGDAAHPMYPVGSNGAGQAILDAANLRAQLEGSGDVVSALRAYEDERLPVTAGIVRMNRAGGPERVIDEVEARAPGGFERIDEVASHGELERIVASYATASGLGGHVRR